MKIYVIIPTHNSEQTILKTLHSFMKAQEKSIAELNAIIVDDHSTDRTLELIGKLPNIYKILHNNLNGVSSARNMALKYLYDFEDANNSWVTFLDADDYLNSSFFEVVNEEVEAFDYIAFEYRNINMGEELKTRDIYSYFNIAECPVEDAIRRNISSFNSENINFNSPWGRLLKLKYLFYNKFYFNERLSYKEDFLFNLEVLNKNPRIGIVDAIGYYHVINPNSVVNNFIKVAYDNEILIQNKIRTLSLGSQLENIASYNGWLGLQYVYVFPKHYVNDTQKKRKSRFNRVHNFMKLFSVTKYNGSIISKEFIFFLLYKIKAFKIIDTLFSFRR